MLAKNNRGIGENTVFKGYKNGVFFDVGSHNGMDINNTLYFEENNNWS